MAKKPTTCHPDRPYFCRGLCKACYIKHWRKGEIQKFAPFHQTLWRTPRSTPIEKDVLSGFDVFCDQQRLRLMQSIIGYAPENHIEPEDLEATYRELRLGPALDGADRFEDRIQIELRTT